MKQSINSFFILDTVCNYYNIESINVINNCNKAFNCKVRQVYCYLSREVGNNKYHIIGNTINRNHSTCIHHYKKSKFEYSIYPDFKTEIEELKSIINDNLKKI